jgi:hypothetical protein
MILLTGGKKNGKASEERMKYFSLVVSESVLFGEY